LQKKMKAIELGVVVAAAAVTLLLCFCLKNWPLLIPPVFCAFTRAGRRPERSLCTTAKLWDAAWWEHHDHTSIATWRASAPWSETQTRTAVHNTV
jgi:hypothetical protein